jgi:hypothetical protein
LTLKLRSKGILRSLHKSPSFESPSTWIPWPRTKVFLHLFITSIYHRFFLIDFNPLMNRKSSNKLTTFQTLFSMHLTNKIISSTFWDMICWVFLLRREMNSMSPKLLVFFTIKLNTLTTKMKR